MKTGRVFICILLALAMIVSLTPFNLSTVRADGEDPTVTVETHGGVYESVPVTETETVQDGVTVTTQTATDAVTESGMIVSYESENKLKENGLYEFKDHYTAKDAENTYEAEGGSEKSNEYVSPLSEVGIKIDLNDIGESSTVDGPEPGIIEITGDQKESEDDGIYDYTITERLSQSQVKVTTKSLQITDAHGEVNPDEMEYLHTEIVGTADIDYIDKIGKNSSNLSPMGRIDRENMGGQTPVDGYEYVMLGSDQWSRFWTAYLFSTPGEVANPPQYPGPDEEPVFTDPQGNSYYARRRHSDFATATAGIRFYEFVLPNGQVYTANEYFGEDVPEANRYFIAAWGMIELFTMSDIKGNMVTTYCADVTNPEEKGWGYNISNLEDAKYYSVEEAKHIRAICNKGYWGTESGFGSLAALKDTMRASGKFTEEEVNRLTDGMAMNAMQTAIWHYSNKMNNMVYLGAHDVHYWRTPYGSITRTPDAASPAATTDAQLILKLHNYLVNLEPEAIPADQVSTENTIINENNFIKSASLTITGKPEDNPNNQDMDETNDVYTVDLDVEFKVKPATENGDKLELVMYDKNGNPLNKDLVQGSNRDAEPFILDDVEYHLEGLELQEGENALQFVLTGSQNLKNDTYFFISENRDGEDSQPMVGIASGKRDVNISMDLTFELDVVPEEVKTEHIWRTERDIEELIDIPVEKKWVGDEKLLADRPKSITVHLFADGTEVASASITPDATGNWSYTFTQLPKTKDGQDIVYTITEDPVDKYTTTISGFVITNEHVPGTGDSTNFTWFFIMAAAVLGLIGTLALGVKKE